MTNAATPTAAAPLNPGKTMGVIAFVLSIIGGNLLAIILGFVGLNKSRSVGQKNGFAVAGIVIGFIGLIGVIALLASGGALFSSLSGA